MTVTQLSKRVAAMQKELRSLKQTLDYELSVEAIRRGLESTERGEGRTPSAVFARIRRKYKVKG